MDNRTFDDEAKQESKVEPEPDRDIDLQYCKDFIKDCEDERKNFFAAAEQSWREIKKQKQSGALWSVMPNSARKSVRFPLWYSTFKIRKPFVLSRLGIPIGQDISGGDDPVGRTAAELKERLCKSILRTFDAMEPLSGARDDMLATNFGQTRGYYDADEVEELKKIYLNPIQDAQTGQTLLMKPDGSMVNSDEAIHTDEKGPYIESDKKVKVERERVYIKHVLWKDFYVDPTAYCWSDVRELAFGYDYSETAYKKRFGAEALAEVKTFSRQQEGKKIKRTIRVYEYWNLDYPGVKYFTDMASDFLTLETNQDGKDPYGLKKTFPCPKPMLDNAPTDSFWPIPEWYQMNDLLLEIHNIATAIFVLSRAIRIRGLFDKNIPGLQSLVNEVSTADWIGIPGLMQAMQQAGGNIANAIAYLPIEPMVESLNNMYQALQQRLTSYAQLTGTSDLLQGMAMEQQRDVTFGEQQMKAKFAMSQIEPWQEDMQRFTKDNYELLCEMALKNFTDETLSKYFNYETLDPDDKQRYSPAVDLLKNDDEGRFRIELETDSTIAINQEYLQQNVTQMTTAVTQAIEATAQAIQSAPMLAPTLIKMTQNLVTSFQGGRELVDDVKRDLDAVVQKIQQQQANPQQPPPDPTVLKMQSDERIAKAKIDAEAQAKAAQMQNDNRLEGLEGQLKTMETQAKMKNDADKHSLSVAKLISEVTTAQKQFAQDNARLVAEIREAQDGKSIDKFKVILQAQEQAFEQRMEKLNTSLQHLQHQHETMQTAFNQKLEANNQLLEIVKEHKNQPPPQAPQIMNHVHMPKPGRKITNIHYKPDGSISHTETTEIPVDLPSIGAPHLGPL